MPLLLGTIASTLAPYAWDIIQQHLIEPLLAGSEDEVEMQDEEEGE